MSTPIDPLLRTASDRRSTSSGEAVADIFRANRRRLVSLSFAITLDAMTAEEVVQDAFVGLHRNGAHVQNVLGYLQRSVVNLSVTVIRRRRMVEQTLVHPVGLVASAPEVDELWSMVVALPANQRAVVVLRFWEDMTVDAIAETLGVPAGSVKSTLHRAISQLRKVVR